MNKICQLMTCTLNTNIVRQTTRGIYFKSYIDPFDNKNSDCIVFVCMSLDPLCNEAKLKRLRPRIAGVSRAEELMLQSKKNTQIQTHKQPIQIQS